MSYNKKEIRTRSTAKGKQNPYKRDIIYSDEGQWRFPGQITRIPGGDITMQGVPYPVFGVDDMGVSQMMMPGQDYKFPGNYVTEFPVMDESVVPLNTLVPTQNLAKKDRKLVDQIKATLRNGGTTEPLEVKSGTQGLDIKDGHHRYLAYKELGINSVPVKFQYGGGFKLPAYMRTDLTRDEIVPILNVGYVKGHPVTKRQGNFFMEAAGLELNEDGEFVDIDTGLRVDERGGVDLSEIEEDLSEMGSEFKKGGEKRKRRKLRRKGLRGTTKRNLVTAVNYLMARNEMLYGPKGKRLYLPRRQDGGDILSNIYSKYPGLERMGDVTLKADPSFTREATGYGDIEYHGINPQGRGTIIYPTGLEYPHPDPTKMTHGIVYNPETNDEQSIMLDMLHGMVADPNYAELRNKFKKNFLKVHRGDLERDWERKVKEEGEGDGKEHFTDNWIDGQIRALMIDPSDTEAFKKFRYWPEAQETYFKDPEIKTSFNQLKNYIESPSGAYMLPEVTVTPKKNGGWIDKYQEEKFQWGGFKDRRRLKKYIDQERDRRMRYMQTPQYVHMLRDEHGLPDNAESWAKMEELRDKKLKYLEDVKVRPGGKRHYVPFGAAGAWNPMNKKITYVRDSYTPREIASIFSHEEGHAEDEAGREGAIPGIGNAFLSNLFDIYKDKGIISTDKDFSGTTEELYEARLDDMSRKYDEEHDRRWKEIIPDIKLGFPHGVHDRTSGKGNYSQYYYVDPKTGENIVIKPGEGQTIGERIEELFPNTFTHPEHWEKELARWKLIEESRKKGIHTWALTPSGTLGSDVTPDMLLPGEVGTYQEEKEGKGKWVGEDYFHWSRRGHPATDRLYEDGVLDQMYRDYMDYMFMGDRGSENTKGKAVSYFDPEVYNQPLMEKLAKDHLEASKVDKRTKPGEYERELFYYYKPTEVKSRLKALRDYAQRRGYKPGTEFKDKWLEKIKKADRMTRMQYEDLKKYNQLTDEEIKKMMLLFAKAETDQTHDGIQMAKQGGWINKYQEGGTPTFKSAVKNLKDPHVVMDPVLQKGLNEGYINFDPETEQYNLDLHTMPFIEGNDYRVMTSKGWLENWLSHPARSPQWNEIIEGEYKSQVGPLLTNKKELLKFKDTYKDNILSNLRDVPTKDFYSIPGKAMIYANPHYNSSSKYVYFPTEYDADPDDTGIHEYTHATRLAEGFDKPYFRSYINNIIKDDSHVKAKRDSYYHDPNEIFSRIMQMRYNHNLNPRKKVTLKEVQDMRAKEADEFWGGEDMFRNLEDKTIQRLFNELVEGQQSAPGVEDLPMGKKGGSKWMHKIKSTGQCTGKNFGGPRCRPGTRQYAFAKRVRPGGDLHREFGGEWINKYQGGGEWFYNEDGTVDITKGKGKEEYERRERIKRLTTPNVKLPKDHAGPTYEALEDPRVPKMAPVSPVDLSFLPPPLYTTQDDDQTYLSADTKPEFLHKLHQAAAEEELRPPGYLEQFAMGLLNVPENLYETVESFIPLPGIWNPRQAWDTWALTPQEMKNAKNWNGRIGEVADYLENTYGMYMGEAMLAKFAPWAASKIPTKQDITDAFKYSKIAQKRWMNSPEGIKATAEYKEIVDRATDTWKKEVSGQKGRLLDLLQESSMIQGKDMTYAEASKLADEILEDVARLTVGTDARQFGRKQKRWMGMHQHFNYNWAPFNIDRELHLLNLNPKLTKKQRIREGKSLLEHEKWLADKQKKYGSRSTFVNPRLFSEIEMRTGPNKLRSTELAHEVDRTTRHELTHAFNEIMASRGHWSGDQFGANMPRKMLEGIVEPTDFTKKQWKYYLSPEENLARLAELRKFYSDWEFIGNPYAKVTGHDLHMMTQGPMAPHPSLMKGYSRYILEGLEDPKFADKVAKAMNKFMVAPPAALGTYGAYKYSQDTQPEYQLGGKFKKRREIKNMPRTGNPYDSEFYRQYTHSFGLGDARDAFNASLDPEEHIPMGTFEISEKGPSGRYETRPATEAEHLQYGQDEVDRIKHKRERVVFQSDPTGEGYLYGYDPTAFKGSKELRLNTPEQKEWNIKRFLTQPIIQNVGSSNVYSNDLIDEEGNYIDVSGMKVYPSSMSLDDRHHEARKEMFEYFLNENEDTRKGRRQAYRKMNKLDKQYVEPVVESMRRKKKPRAHFKSGGWLDKYQPGGGIPQYLRADQENPYSVTQPITEEDYLKKKQQRQIQQAAAKKHMRDVYGIVSDAEKEANWWKKSSGMVHQPMIDPIDFMIPYSIVTKLGPSVAAKAPAALMRAGIASADDFVKAGLGTVDDFYRILKTAPTPENTKFTGQLADELAELGIAPEYKHITTTSKLADEAMENVEKPFRQHERGLMDDMGFMSKRYDETFDKAIGQMKRSRDRYIEDLRQRRDFEQNKIFDELIELDKSGKMTEDELAKWMTDKIKNIEDDFRERVRLDYKYSRTDLQYHMARIREYLAKMRKDPSNEAIKDALFEELIEPRLSEIFNRNFMPYKLADDPTTWKKGFSRGDPNVLPADVPPLVQRQHIGLSDMDVDELIRKFGRSPGGDFDIEKGLVDLPNLFNLGEFGYPGTRLYIPGQKAIDIETRRLANHGFFSSPNMGGSMRPNWMDFGNYPMPHLQGSHNPGAYVDYLQRLTKPITKRVNKYGGETWLDNYQTGGEGIPDYLRADKKNPYFVTQPISEEDYQKKQHERAALMHEARNHMRDVYGIISDEEKEMNWWRNASGRVEWPFLDPIDMVVPYAAATKVGTKAVTKLPSALSKAGVKSFDDLVGVGLRGSDEAMGSFRLPKAAPPAPAITSAKNYVSPIVGNRATLQSLRKTNPKGLHNQVDKIGEINVKNALNFIKNTDGPRRAELAQKAIEKVVPIPTKMNYELFKDLITQEIAPLEKMYIGHQEQGVETDYGITGIGYFKNPRGGISLESSGEPSLDDWTTERIVFFNEEQIGRGSDLHNNPQKTLAHVNIIEDANNPETLITTQVQSDWRHTDPSTQKMPAKKVYEDRIKESQKFLDEGGGDPMDEYYLLDNGDYASVHTGDVISRDDLMNFIVKHAAYTKRQEDFIKLHKTFVDNYDQRKLYHNNIDDRVLQELFIEAGKRGKNKVWLPHPTTAADIQNYVPHHKTHKSFVEAYEKEFKEMNPDFVLAHSKEDIKHIKDAMKTERDYPYYGLTEEFILKRYKNAPKDIKKLLGIDYKLVADDRGNMWYEFIVPDDFIKGTAEIKAFKKGGEKSWIDMY